jgi:hypothetical protein
MGGSTSIGSDVFIGIVGSSRGVPGSCTQLTPAVLTAASRE